MAHCLNALPMARPQQRILVMRLPALCLAGALAFLPGFAAAGESAFYRGVAGEWEGPGEIVAGKYKGTKFNCALNGAAQGGGDGFSLTGNCRVGVFNQPIRASVSSSARGLTGRFLDGEAGEGMDIVGGRYSQARLTVNVKRKDLRGVMSARLAGANKLNITISVNVDGDLVPVIGMSLDRVSQADQIVTSLLSNE